MSTRILSEPLITQRLQGDNDPINPSVVAGVALGFGGTALISGNNLTGLLTLTTGNPLLSAGIVCTVNFNAPFDNPPKVFLQFADAGSLQNLDPTPSGHIPFVNTTVNNFTVNIRASYFTSFLQMKFFYLIIG